MEDDFLKTNVKFACVLKMDLERIVNFKKELANLVTRYGGDIIYNSVSMYRLKIVEEKNNNA